MTLESDGSSGFANAFVVAILIGIVTAAYFVLTSKKPEKTQKEGTPQSTSTEPAHVAINKKQKTKTKQTKKKKTAAVSKPENHARFKKKFGGHSSNVLDSAVSPNGEWMATSGEDGQLRITQNAGGDVFLRANVDSNLLKLAWLPDNRTICGCTQHSSSIVFYRMRQKKQPDKKFPLELVELVKRRFATNLHHVSTLIVDQSHVESCLILVAGMQSGDSSIETFGVTAFDGKTGQSLHHISMPHYERISSNGTFVCGQDLAVKKRSNEVKLIKLVYKKIKNQAEPVFDKLSKHDGVTLISKHKINNVNVFCGEGEHQGAVLLTNQGMLQVYKFGLESSQQVKEPHCTIELDVNDGASISTSKDGSRIAVVSSRNLLILTMQEDTISHDFTIENAHTVGVANAQFVNSILYTRGTASKEVFAWDINK